MRLLICEREYYRRDLLTSILQYLYMYVDHVKDIITTLVSLIIKVREKGNTLKVLSILFKKKKIKLFLHLSFYCSLSILFYSYFHRIFPNNLKTENDVNFSVIKKRTDIV